jgi:hypothetical protein
VKIHVDDVEPHVAGANDADDRVEVGPVVVEETTDLVHRRLDLLDVLFEQAQRVRVGQHQAGHIVVEGFLERVDVHQAPLVGADLLCLVPGEAHAGRIGSVSRVRDDDPLAHVALSLVEGPHDQQTRELPLSAGRGLEGKAGHARRVAERLLERPQQFERTLGQLVPRVRMQVREARHRRSFFGHLRVVFHRARSQRVGADVDRPVPLGEPGEVAHQVPLAHFG